MPERIKTIEALPDYCLRAIFDDGQVVIYDVKDDMNQIPS